MKAKRLVFILVISMLVMGGVVYAGGTTKNIKVLLNGYSVLLNGEDQKTDTIFYNNTVYVPVDTMANAMKLKLDIDQKVQKVNIGEDVTKLSQEIPLQLPASMTINNVTINLNKVEQDNDSLRIFITYINNSNDEVSTNDSLTRIVSARKQYEYDTQFAYDRYSVNDDIEIAPSSIEPTVSADSVIFMKPIQNVDKVNLVLKANYEEYRFNNVKVDIK